MNEPTLAQTVRKKAVEESAALWSMLRIVLAFRYF